MRSTKIYWIKFIENWHSFIWIAKSSHKLKMMKNSQISPSKLYLLYFAIRITERKKEKRMWLDMLPNTIMAGSLQNLAAKFASSVHYIPTYTYYFRFTISYFIQTNIRGAQRQPSFKLLGIQDVIRWKSTTTSVLGLASVTSCPKPSPKLQETFYLTVIRASQITYLGKK